MDTHSEFQLGLHFRNLESIETQIETICYSKDVAPEDLEIRLDLFSDVEQEILLELLNKKLVIQESIFKLQGNSLDNVTFLASYL